MNKPTLIALIVSAAVGGGVVTFNACTSNSLREHAETKVDANPLDAPATVPTAEALFLKATQTIPSLTPNEIAELEENPSGKELNLQTRRPVYDLGQTVFAQKYGKPGYTLVGNFFYEGAFYIARIPAHEVKGVFFGVALLPPKADAKFFGGKTFLRIQMDAAHPVELVAEMPDEASLKALGAATPSQALALLPAENQDADPRIENFAISAEPVLTKNASQEPANLNVAIRGAYTQALMFRSMEETLVTLYKAGEPVNEYKLNVSLDEGDTLISEGLKQSQAEGLSRKFAFANNVTSRPYALLRGALGVRDDRFAYLQKVMEKRIPTAAPKVLSENGMQGEIPLQLDRSLSQDSQVAFERVFGGRDVNICKTRTQIYRGYHCDTIQGAVAALEKWGRLPASANSNRTTAAEDHDKEAAMVEDDKAELADERAAQELKKSAHKKGLGAAAGYESDDVLH